MLIFLLFYMLGLVYNVGVFVWNVFQVGHWGKGEKLETSVKY